MKQLLILLCTVFILCQCDEKEPEPFVEVEAKFIADKTFTKAGTSIQFTDESIGEPTNWEWTFTGGTPSTSAEQNPLINYSEPGFYKVILKTSKTNSTYTLTKEDYITVGCNGNNCSSTFTEFSKTSGIVYGIDQNQHQLNLYEPSNDNSDARPLIILFGGGAFNGSDLTLLEPFAAQLTKYGFVVAAARYRNGPSSEGAQNFIRGQQDVNAAVRFFRKEAAQYKIDTDKIFVGGNGTGAFLALSKSYLDDNEVPADLVTTVNNLGGLEGAQGNDGYSSEVVGCISLAGGIYRTLDVIKSDDVPLFAVHGSKDTDVPIGTTPVSGTTLYGAVPITDKTGSVNLLTYLYIIEGGNHDAPRSTPQLYINQLITWTYLVFHQ